MNKFDEFLKKIDNINPNADESLFKIQNKLRENLHEIANTEYTKEEAKDLIFQEDDVLDNQDVVETDTQLWQDIRDIQHDIILFFAQKDAGE